MDTLTAFRILEISSDSSLEEIQEAYLEKVSIYHPEEHPTEFAKIQTAYRTLCRFKKKGEYTEAREETVLEVEPVETAIDDYLGQQELFLKLQEESEKKEKEQAVRAKEYDRLLFLADRCTFGYSIPSDFMEDEIVYLLEKYPLSQKQYKGILAQYRREHLGKRMNKEMKTVIAVLNQKIGIRPPKMKEIVLVSVLLLVASLLLGNLNIDGLSDENYIWAFYCVILFYVFRTVLTPLVSATISLSVLWLYVLFFMYGKDGNYWGISFFLTLALTVALGVAISKLVLRIKKEREGRSAVGIIKNKWLRKMLEWIVIIVVIMMVYFINFSDTIFEDDSQYETSSALLELSAEEFEDLMNDLEELVPFLNSSKQALHKYKYDVSFYSIGESLTILADEEEQIEQIECDEELIHNIKCILDNPRVSNVYWWKEAGREESYYLVVDLDDIKSDSISTIRYGDGDLEDAKVHLGDNWYYCEW